MTRTQKNPNSLANLRPFVKGDERINRKGVPKDAVEARNFIRAVGEEIVKIKAGKSMVDASLFYSMVRDMYLSKNAAKQSAILKAIAPGLLKDTLDITSDGQKIELVVKYATDSLPPETT